MIKGQAFRFSANADFFSLFIAYNTGNLLYLRIYCIFRSKKASTTGELTKMNLFKTTTEKLAKKFLLQELDHFENCMDVNCDRYVAVNIFLQKNGIRKASQIRALKQELYLEQAKDL